MSPRTTAQLKQLKQVRKEQILLAALHLFSEKGYQSTSISAIAKKAALSKGLLYTYFESKEALLNEVVVFSLRDAAEMSLEIFESVKDKTPESVFTMIIELFFTTLIEQKNQWKLTLSLAAQITAIPSVHNSITEIYNGMLAQLEMLFTLLAYKDAKKEAMLLGAILDGISIQYIIFGEDYPLSDLKEMLIKKYIP